MKKFDNNFLFTCMFKVRTWKNMLVEDFFITFFLQILKIQKTYYTNACLNFILLCNLKISHKGNKLIFMING